jgi:hypothetical protein
MIFCNFISLTLTLSQRERGRSFSLWERVRMRACRARNTRDVL